MPLTVPGTHPTAAASADAPSAGKSLIPDALAAELHAHLAAVRSTLSVFQAKPELPSSLTHARDAILHAAECIVQIPKRAQAEAIVTEVRALIREISVSGIHDTTLPGECLDAARRIVAHGWAGVLAAMALTSAWQWPDAPELDKVPDWLWGDYTAWLFANPQGFCAVGQAEIFAQHSLKRLQELERWTARNAGSQAVRAALQAYVQDANAIPLYFSRQNLRPHAELRGKLLKRAFAREAHVYPSYAQPRLGRKLRVGFVNRHFGSQTETYTTLPTFEQLDRDRFEVILFVHHTSDSVLEAHCRSRAKEFYVFPHAFEGQLSMLRDAALDVVVFGTNLTAVCNEVALLALHRVAPLQVVNNSSCITSGFPEIDLYVSGTLTETSDAATHFSERLGLLPGPAHAFNYEADRQEPTTSWTRADLGIPEDAAVFVSAANYFKIIPEMQQAWAKLLAATPGSYLVVHPFNPNWSSSYPIQRFCAEFDRVLAQHGVDEKRLIVSSARFPSRHDVKELLRVGDVYLDTFPFGGVNSLVDPLELGIPVITWEGDTFRSRMGSALLRAIGLPELIVQDEAAYLAAARSLAVDTATRAAVKARIAATMERQPVFLDSLAASDAFGDLVEVAFDELVNVGHEQFRSDRTPLLAANFPAPQLLSEGSLSQARFALRASPNDPSARYRVGVGLNALGQHERASEYLLAAVQHDENNAPLWYELAVSFRRGGQSQLALQALEASLRVDKNQLEAWLMFAELAEAVGSHDLAREAAQVAQSLAPDDARSAAYL